MFVIVGKRKLQPINKWTIRDLGQPFIILTLKTMNGAHLNTQLTNDTFFQFDVWIENIFPMCNDDVKNEKVRAQNSQIREQDRWCAYYLLLYQRIFTTTTWHDECALNLESGRTEIWNMKTVNAINYNKWQQCNEMNRHLIFVVVNFIEEKKTGIITFHLR